MIDFADRMNKIRSGIRGPLYVETLKMQERGEKVLRLNTGNPAEFGFKMPESVKSALYDGAERAVAYTEPQGMKSAREAILAYHETKGFENIDVSDIFIGNGVSELAEMAMLATMNAGDEMLVPTPNYSLWSNSLYIAGATPVHYILKEENGWMPDVEDIKAKITPRTRAILIINPNNPTGSLVEKELLLKILEVARENGLFVVSDEIYDRLVFDGKTHYSCAALAPDLPVITLNGLSKSHIICGFRCGWLVTSGKNGALKKVKEALFSLSAVRLCGNTLTQLVIPAALDDEESTKSMLVSGGRLYEQRKAVTDVFSACEEITCVPNSAAFYVFPRINVKLPFKSDIEFGLALLHEKKILIVPGSGFEYNGNDHFRIVMLPEPETLGKAMKDVVDFIRKHAEEK